MLACDLVVAAHGSKFGVPEVKRALVAAAAPRCCCPGASRFAAAMELLLTGEPITRRAGGGARAGQPARPGRHARSTARSRLAEVIAANGPLAVAVTKQIARRRPTGRSRRAGTGRKSCTSRCSSPADAREGAAAFAEKRAPVWRGVIQISN